MITGRAVATYRITIGDGGSTEALVAAGHYGYAHSCVTSENFPARPLGGRRVREVVLVEFADAVTPADAIVAAARLNLERPVYEDALYFGIEHPDVQREGPVVFLHDPWVGFFGRRDVLCLWSNAGRRELGLEGFDDLRSRQDRFAFIRPTGGAGSAPSVGEAPGAARDPPPSRRGDPARSSALAEPRGVVRHVPGGPSMAIRRMPSSTGNSVPSACIAVSSSRLPSTGPAPVARYWERPRRCASRKAGGVYFARAMETLTDEHFRPGSGSWREP